MPYSPLQNLSGVGIVAIGRNEGDRFRACLASLPQGIPAVYVDSGSTDSSVALAEEAGVHVVHLPTDQGFTAARARNAGWRALLAQHPDLRFIQFLDGDCALDPDWLSNGVAEIEKHDRIAIVFGRLKERYPEMSIYNAMCDREWNVAIGEVRACGGNALIKVVPLVQVHGFNSGLIAGEEPDLCLRMRLLGWSIYRIAGQMGMHDAAILSFGNWWKRSKRTGYAYAEHNFLHKRSANPDWTKAMLSMIVWAIILPSLFLFGLMLSGVYGSIWILLSVFVLLFFVFQFARLLLRCRTNGLTVREGREEAFLLILAKFAHLAGASKFGLNHLNGRSAVLIEYK